MTVGLTRVDAPGGGIVVNARRTHPELLAPAPGGPRLRRLRKAGWNRPDARTTPTGFSRRDSAMPILSRLGANAPHDGRTVTVRGRRAIRPDRDAPAATPELRREQLDRELSEWAAERRQRRAAAGAA